MTKRDGATCVRMFAGWLHFYRWASYRTASGTHLLVEKGFLLLLDRADVLLLVRVGPAGLLKD